MSVKGREIDVSTAIVAFVIAAIAALAVWRAREFSVFGSIFPIATGLVLLLASLGVFVRCLMAGTSARERSIRNLAGLQKSLALVAVLIAWAVSLQWAGFVAPSWVGFVAIALISDGRLPTLRRSVLYGVVGLVVVVGLQLLFQQVLNVRLP